MTTAGRNQAVHRPTFQAILRLPKPFTELVGEVYLEIVWSIVMVAVVIKSVSIRRIEVIIGVGLPVYVVVRSRIGIRVLLLVGLILILLVGARP